jgi:hypothetical protein
MERTVISSCLIEEEGFRIQMKKKVPVQRPHQRQTATGLVVNQQINLPLFEEIRPEKRAN